MSGLKKIISSSFLAICVSANVQAQSFIERRSLGATLDASVYLKAPAAPPLARGDYEQIPVSISLKKFTPKVGNQGNQGSCVGWATAYAARSLLARQNIQNSSAILSELTPFSPSYIYNQIKVEGCNPGGSLISDALNLLKSDGVVSVDQFPYDESICNELPTSQLRKIAAQNRIDDYQRLFSPSTRNKHIPVRLALAQGRPVVIGMAVSDEFFEVKSNYTLSDEGLFKIKTGAVSGHAMTVIGYDDQKLGGAFEIMNSWGESWGQDGYFWMPYSDFNLATLEAYSIHVSEPDPNPHPDPNTGPEEAVAKSLSAKVTFFNMDDQELSLQDQSSYFVLKEPLYSGDRFRVQFEVEDDAYVYVLGGDNSGNIVEIFPGSSEQSALLFSSSTMLLPGPTEDYYTRLNDTSGTDYYLVLVSRRALNTTSFIAAQPYLDFTNADGLLRSLSNIGLSNGRRIVPPKVNQGSKSVSADIGQDDVMPMLVTIGHLEKRLSKIDTEAPIIVLSALDGHDLRNPGGLIVDTLTREVELRGSAQDISDIYDLTMEGATSIKFSSKGAFVGKLKIPITSNELSVEIEAMDTYGNKSSLSVRIQYKP